MGGHATATRGGGILDQDPTTAPLDHPHARCAVVQDAASTQATLTRARLVALTGAGGAGKSRLALRVAANVHHAYPDGVWVCELAGIADPAAVPDLVATTLGVQRRADSTVTTRLVEYLRGRTMLLLLDNCEHVLTGVAQLLHAALPHSPGVTVLATSREPLGLDGEHVLAVPPLPSRAAPSPVRCPRTAGWRPPRRCPRWPCSASGPPRSPAR